MLEDIFKERDDYEDAISQVTDEFYNHESLDLREAPQNQYGDILARSVAQVKSNLGEDPREANFPGYLFEHSTGIFEIRAIIPDFDEDVFVNGKIEILFPAESRTFHNSHKAEPGSLLWKLRKDQHEIVEHNSTPYLEPVFKNEESDTHPHVRYTREHIANIQVTPNFDEETLDETINSIDTIGVELDNLYQNLTE